MLMASMNRRTWSLWRMRCLLILLVELIDIDRAPLKLSVLHVCHVRGDWNVQAEQPTHTTPKPNPPRHRQSPHDFLRFACRGPHLRTARAVENFSPFAVLIRASAALASSHSGYSMRSRQIDFASRYCSGVNSTSC